MAVGSMEVPGNAVIKKKSSMNEITSENDSYSLKGAEYTLVGEKTGEVIRVTLDERGASGVAVNSIVNVSSSCAFASGAAHKDDAAKTRAADAQSMISFVFIINSY